MSTKNILNKNTINGGFFSFNIFLMNAPELVSLSFLHTSAAVAPGCRAELCSGLLPIAQLMDEILFWSKNGPFKM
jgi:hypothetical protein